MVAFAVHLKINLCPQQVSAIGCTPPCSKKVGAMSSFKERRLLFMFSVSRA